MVGESPGGGGGGMLPRVTAPKVSASSFEGEMEVEDRGVTGAGCCAP